MKLEEAISKVTSMVSVVVIKPDGTRVDYGVQCRKLITTDGATYLAAAFAGGPTIANMKYHAMGIGTLAEAQGDTQLGSEVARGNSPNVSSLAQVYTSVETIAATATWAITEHGIFNQGTLGGTLWDRSKLANTINVFNGDSVEFTYNLTVQAGT